MKKLSGGKAPGPDSESKPSNSPETSTTPIKHLFSAGLAPSYHPMQFEHATTDVLQKPGKESYNTPKSWRPIALPSSLRKMLEKIIANRPKGLTIPHTLLPPMQFGGAGRPNTTAPESILNVVYASWTSKSRRKATLPSLDIWGAFDHVDRVKLLQTPIDYCIPY